MTSIIMTSIIIITMMMYVACPTVRWECQLCPVGMDDEYEYLVAWVDTYSLDECHMA